MRELLFRLTRIDRRIIYGLVFLTVALPFLLKRAPKVEITKEVRNVYEFIDNLPPGSRIVISADYGPSSMPEIQPMLKAICLHAFEKGHRVYLMTHWTYQGLVAGQEGLRDAVQQFNKEIREGKHPERKDTLKYGVDYVVWGYRPGGVAVIVNLGQDISSVFLRDLRGNPINSLPAMQGFKSLKDLGTMDHPRGILIGLEAGFTGETWLIYGQASDKYPAAMGATGVVAPVYYQYLQAGYLVGFLGGLKGAAEYEQLLGRPDAASLGMMSQSMTHILIVLLIFLGNLGFFLTRRR